MSFDVSEMKAKLEELLANAPAKKKKAVRLAAEFVLSAAIPLTPVDEGTLRRSGRVEVTDKGATVSFNTPYARRQHEDMSYSHPGGGGAKYLEKAMNGSKQQVKAIIERTCRLDD